MKQWIGYSVLGLVIVLGLTWLIQGNDFFMYKFFGIKYENVRREIFEQSQAYNQGMVQELDNMMFEYQKADKEHKAALGSIFLRRASYYGIDKLPSDLRQFANELKQNGGY
jgi:hypothetical protein